MMDPTRYFQPEESEELTSIGISYTEVWVSHTDGMTVSRSVVNVNSMRSFRREMYKKKRWVIKTMPAVTLPDYSH